MKSSLTVFAFAVSAAVSMQAQQVPALRALTEPWPEIVKVDGIEIVHVQKNIYMLVGGGANVTAQIGDQGVMLRLGGEAAYDQTGDLEGHKGRPVGRCGDAEAEQGLREVVIEAEDGGER